MEIQLFDNPEFGALRTVEQEGVILFCAKDAARMLGYSNPNDAISKHCRGVAFRYPIQDALGRTQDTRFISEGDLYRLIASSRLESAERFESWVFDEVLPSIRRHGGYMAAKSDETPEETMARAVLIAQEAIARKDASIAGLEAKNAALSPKACMYDACMAGERWTSVTEAARLLAQYDRAIRRKDLFEWLRRDGVITRDNQASRYGIERGYAVNYQPPARFDQATGELVRTKPYAKLTSKGLDWCIRRYCDRREAAL